jgi:hypothetical protein
VNLNFTNPSRSYDSTRRAVRFWGYDSSAEVSFFVTEDALHHLQPSTSAADDWFLNAFDAHRRRIQEVATRVYARGRKGSYELHTRDF